MTDVGGSMGLETGRALPHGEDGRVVMEEQEG